MKFPDRFYTGCRNRTIMNPALLYRGDSGSSWSFEGRVEDYNFEKQTRNFNRLQEVLEENGTKLLYVAASHSPGDRGINHRFAAVAEDGSLLWYKYVAYVAQGGQNHVFVAGYRLSLSLFLALSPKKQTALLSNSKSAIKKAFSYDPGVLNRWDDTAKLWS